MADSVISFLLENLSQLLAHEANLLWGVDDKVTSLRNELETIDAFLRYAERKKISNEILDVVIGQIKEAARESEDVIDNFIAHVTKHRRRNILGRMIHVADHAKMLRKVAGKIEMLRNRINEIHNNKIKYNIEDSTSTSTEEDTQRWELIRERRRNVEEDDVVGLFRDSSVVIQRLTEGDCHSRLTVVSIIGMGGSGKTTLARKVYNDDQVKNYFGCCAWVYVSNDCRPRELLITLLKSLTSISQDVYSWSEDELKSKVRECLQGKRYLVVLDDIWKTEDWDSIKDIFPNDGIGSRILITSRLKETASYTGCTQPYNLPLLSLEESWELFRKKVFRGEDWPSDLEPLGRKIAGSCHGLPLSIVVLSGYLANKEKSQEEWSKVMGHVNWYLARDETPVKDIVLQLSYDNLPRRLKPCFLYFGVFPEDFEIHVRPLIQKWVAEGFIQQCGTRNPEDVGEDYLYELVDRSLIQVASRRSDGGVKTCRIHDLLRDLCLREGEKDKFFEVCTGTNVLTQRITKPRRLSIHCSMPSYASSESFDHSCTRSLICFGEEYVFTNEHWNWLVKGFKLARVLDIGQVDIGGILSFPRNIDALIHLRYLSISSVRLLLDAVIPNAICNLSNLETLDLVGSIFPARGRVVFPSGMWKLKRLRHIRASSPMILSDFSGSPTKIMYNLLSLSFVIVNEATISLIQKGMFPNLQKLGVEFESINIYNEEWQRLWQGIEHLTCLNTLKLVLSFGRLVSRVESVAFPAHITKLKLVNAIQENWKMDMISLANFTNLQILKLGRTSTAAPTRFDLKCSTGWFPQLRVLQMKRLGVRNWELANGAMPRLQRLVIDQCDLHDLPGELWSLTTLRQVQVLSPSAELTQVLQNLERKDGVELIIRY